MTHFFLPNAFLQCRIANLKVFTHFFKADFFIYLFFQAIAQTTLKKLTFAMKFIYGFNIKIVKFSCCSFTFFRRHPIALFKMYSYSFILFVFPVLNALDKPRQAKKSAEKNRINVKIKFNYYLYSINIQIYCNCTKKKKKKSFGKLCK